MYSNARNNCSRQFEGSEELIPTLCGNLDLLFLKVQSKPFRECLPGFSIFDSVKIASKTQQEFCPVICSHALQHVA